MDEEYKYTLIVSQYYYSRHMFIVKHDENFIENARKFATELITYKRRDNDYWAAKNMYIGDLDPEWVGDRIKRQYNINDCGDIYFINSQYANYLMKESIKYELASKRESVGFQKKTVLEDIHNRHNYNAIAEIVTKYFELA